MKRTHIPTLSVALTICALATSVIAGIVKPEKPPAEADRALLTEARQAVHAQLIDKLPYKIRGHQFSRRMIIPDPIYSAEFASTATSSGHMAFLLIRKAKDEKLASPIGKGYYDPSTKRVYLFDKKRKTFVESRRHALVVDGGKKSTSLKVAPRKTKSK